MYSIYKKKIKEWVKLNIPFIYEIKFDIDPYLTKDHLIKNIPLFPIAIPIVIIIRIIRKLLFIKIVHIYGTAIGHFSVDPYLCLSTQVKKHQKVIVCLCVISRTNKVCNLF